MSSPFDTLSLRFSYTGQARRYAFELTKSDPHARLNHIVTSILFSALTIEAYMNHLGSLRISFWATLKKILSTRDKLDVLCHDLGFSQDFGKRPWQTLSFIFRLRSLLVHAQTETL
jgi:hypothetical protein